MLIGVDFDNTIVCYDALFHKAALERGFVSPQPLLSKDQVRDRLRRDGREEDWIELQGYVYGPCMKDAQIFPGAFEFFAECRRRGVPARIISHRTLHPFRGPRYDLHEAARDFLRRRGFFDPARLGLNEADVCLELTKQAKLERIRTSGCTHFIDDLPEFLAEPGFPPGVERILFDPRKTPWAEISGRILHAV